MDLVDSQTTRVLQKAMDGLFERQKAIASNIANAQTPGYHAVSVSFEDSLKSAIAEDSQGVQKPDQMMATQAMHYTNQGQLSQDSTAGQATIERSQFFFSQDKNGVDVEQQIAALAKNAGTFDTLSKIESKMLNSLRNAMKD